MRFLSIWCQRSILPCVRGWRGAPRMCAMPRLSSHWARSPVLSGLAPAPLADGGLVGYRAASHGGADADAVLGMRVGSCDRAARAYRPRLSPLPLPTLRQAIQRALRHSAEPDAVSVRRHRPRGALAPALQAEPPRPARDVRRARHRVQL